MRFIPFFCSRVSKKPPFQAVFLLVRALGLASPLRRRSLTLTGILMSASPPCQTLSQGSPPTALNKQKSTPKGAYLFIGTRAGI